MHIVVFSVLLVPLLFIFTAILIAIALLAGSLVRRPADEPCGVERDRLHDTSTVEGLRCALLVAVLGGLGGG